MAEGNVVSDSYDPEFGTGTNAADVQEAIAEVGKKHFDPHLGELKNIVDVVHDDNGPMTARTYQLYLNERELRIIRFCLIRAWESI